MSFHPFSEKNFTIKFYYKLFWKFSLFAVLLFVKNPKNNSDENTKKAYICIAKDQFYIMIIDPFWDSLLEDY